MNRWPVVAVAAAAAAALGALGACKVSGTFACARDDQCGVGGACQPIGYCSFVDSTCASGQRYDDYAGDGLAGTCVGGGDPSDGPLVDNDAPIDGPRPPDADQPDAMPDAFPPLVIRINEGGPDFTGTDYPGDWTGDPTRQHCPSAATYTQAGNIQGTVDDALFHDEVYDIPELNCQVASLPVGMYQVRLLWAELYYDCAGSGDHLFDVRLEGMSTGPTLSSRTDGGGCALDPGGHPYERQVTIPITDGQLDIRITSQGGSTSGVVSAIEVIRVE